VALVSKPSLLIIGWLSPCWHYVAKIFSCIKPGELPINAGEYVAFVISRKIVNGCDAVTIPRIALKKQSREKSNLLKRSI
jgi:hypothetical protein